MWIYLIGVIATIAIMILGHYIAKEDVGVNDMITILFTSLFSWIGFVSIIIVVSVIIVMHFSDNFRNKPIIKWKSRKKDT